MKTILIIRRVMPTFAAVAVLAVCASLWAQENPIAVYEGKWDIQPNGDVKVVRTYTLPMKLYQMWKAGGVDMLEMRAFRADRSNVETADLKTQWDDMNRKLILDVTVLGLANNMGNHWEAKILPGESFSNLDETKKTAYFHFALQGPMGQVQGQDIVQLPADASKPVWNAGNHTLSYELPPFAGQATASGGLVILWWVLAGVCFLGGAGLIAASMLYKPTAVVQAPSIFKQHRKTPPPPAQAA